MPLPDQKPSQWAASGRIAEALLLVLAESGDTGRRNLVLRALESDVMHAQRAGGWISSSRLEAMFKAASVDDLLARRVGQALVRSYGVGFALRYGGLATVEKAYRRVDALLARESSGCHYAPLSVEADRARLRFEPESSGSSQRVSENLGPSFCRMREGMLEALPLLYGLLPARVTETRCAYQGEEACEYTVRWTRTARSGLALGALSGFFLGAGLFAGGVSLGGSLWFLSPVLLASVLLGAGAGRSFDLARQLEVVAGARRGHLALLDQLDETLAERMDGIARLGSPSMTCQRSAVGSDAPTGLIPVSHRQVRNEIEPAHAEPRVEVGGDAEIDLGRILDRAVTRLREGGAESLEVKFDLEETLKPVRGHARQLDFVLDQLLQNAARSTRVAMEEGYPAAMRVSLRGTPDGIEVAIEDEGAGLDPEWIDQIFDPFEEPGGPAQDEGGETLAFCAQIIEGHGGEFRVQSAGERGTRVAFVLPQSGLD